MIPMLLLILTILSCVSAELPSELDPFMEKLFETEQCEDFISGEFTSVATAACEPYTCDFPRQLCVRPSSKYQDKAANMCKDVPSECLTAANGGVPLGPARPTETAPPQPPSPPQPMLGRRIGPGGRVLPGRLITGPPVNPQEICNMGPPTGRFCGFKVMYVYNKETLQCDEFWFPGCRTAETNANLFMDYQDCQRIAEICKPTPAPTLPPPPPPSPPPTPPPPPPPPPPAPVPAPFGMGAGGGDLGGLAGLGGLLGGGAGGGAAPQPAPGGDGEDMGLISLIQKGFVSAQAIKAGGPQGKEAATAAAGQILQQFTGFDLNNIGGNFGNFFGGR